MSENQQFNSVNPTIKLGPTINGQVLYFFGAVHGNDPSDHQFEYLKEFWDEFIANTGPQRTVFVESIVRDAPEQFAEAIIQRGEVGATLWLAQRDGVPVICPEPDDTEQRRALCLKFDSHDVAYTMVIQGLTSWNRRKVREFDFGEAIERFVKRETKFADIFGFTPDTFWFQDQHRKLFGEQQLEDKTFLDSVSDPRKSDTLVNQIVSSRTKMRNEYVLSRIADVWGSGQSVFIVYGKGHLVVLEPALRKMLTPV